MRNELDSFVNPEILLKDAVERDSVKINEFLNKRIREIDGLILNKEEIRAVRKILLSLEGVTKNTPEIVKGKYHTFTQVQKIRLELDVYDLREFLRLFAAETIKELVNQKIQVECEILISNSSLSCDPLIIEIP